MYARTNRFADGLGFDVTGFGAGVWVFGVRCQGNI